MKEFFTLSRKDGAGSYTLRLADGASLPDRTRVEEFGIFSVVDLLASMASLCELRFYQEGKRTKGRDWYKWNYAPNRDQNGTEFKRLLFARLFFFNEALVFDRGPDEILLADSFTRVQNGMEPVRFENVTFNGVTVPRPLGREDVYYFRLAISPQVEALRNNLRCLYSDLMEDARDKYQKSGGRLGVLQVNAAESGAPDYAEKLEKLMNDRFKTFFSSRNAVIPLNDGFTYTPLNGPSSQKSTSEVSDIGSVLQQAQTTACNAFHVSPSLLRGEVTGQQDAARHTISFALKPALRAVDTEISRGLYGVRIMDGWACRAYYGNILMLSPFDVAANVEKLTQNRLYSPNGIRELLDDEQIQEEWADEYTLTKNAESVGGTANGEN